jgi:diguanylate cyclase (GGDEF)-like protein
MDRTEGRQHVKSPVELLPPKRAARRPQVLRLLWAVVLFTILAGFTALFAVMLMDQRNQDWKQAGIAAQNLDTSVRRDILQSFNSADQALLSVREMLRTNPDFRFDQQKRRALLGGSASRTGIGEIYILDKRGNLALSSETSPQTRTNFANEPFFYTHERAKDDALFTARTVNISALKEVVVVLSRRLVDRYGRFSGVAAFSLRLSSFSPLFQSLELGEKGAISLFATDGTLLLRAPSIGGTVGRNYVTSSMFWQLAAAEEPFATASSIDGVERLFSASHVDSLPLIVAVGLSVEEIYAGWSRLALTNGIAFALLAVCVVGLSIMLGLELRQRRNNEQRYRTLAHVDGLTGLYNRRRFDHVLQHEFANAEKLNTPLSVIMIDVDRFKFFNDLYGHQAGDDCLTLIARTIQALLKRPTDIAARYGGEEISIILPNTDASGAEMMAEYIRAAIADLAIAHSRSHTGHVTASLGTATSHDLANHMPATPAALVAAADEALYGAKRSGRNRVVTHARVKRGISAPMPTNEPVRLIRVENILASLTAETGLGLDRVSRMAAQSFGTGLAFVTLIDAAQQRFIGRTGLAIDGTTRDLSFCAHALGGADVLVVLDATRDIRFRENPLVTGDPGIRFYAGAPLVDTETGTVIGTLCIADHKPRLAFSDEQRDLLSGFASLAMEQLLAALTGPEIPAETRRANA